MLYSFDNEVKTDVDVFFMNEALKEAHQALAKNEVPIGAVVVANNRIFGRGHNLTEQLADVTAHAELQAFTAASNSIGGKYLHHCTLYVTLEPCVMCAGAAYWTQIGRLVYGASDPKRGYHTCSPNLLHPKTKVTNGILAETCGTILSNFFRKKRI